MNGSPYLSLWEAIGLLAFGDPSDTVAEKWRLREIAAGRKGSEVEADEAVRVFAAVDALHHAAGMGTLIVMARHPHDLVPGCIPTENWRTLEFDPIGGPDRAGAAIPIALPEDEVPRGFPSKSGRAAQTWIDLRFPRAEIEKVPPIEPEDLIVRCAAWLRSRRDQLGTEVRKVLLDDARHAMPDLTTRQFDQAYRVVYQRKVGAPPKTPQK